MGQSNQRPTVYERLNLTALEHGLVANNFDPDEPSLTIGHPKIGQVDLQHSFGTDDFYKILEKLSGHLDVFSIKTSDAYAEYDYTWRESKQLQVPLL